MKTKQPRDAAPLCPECARAFQELIPYNVNPEQAQTVANGIQTAMSHNQQAFQELSFQLAHMTALSRRAFQHITGRVLDDTLVGHLKDMGLGNQPPQRVAPPNNCAGTQIHVYASGWLRLNELVRLNPPGKSIERLELRLLQQVMNFYQRGEFPQLEHATGADSNNDVTIRPRP